MTTDFARMFVEMKPGFAECECCGEMTYRKYRLADDRNGALSCRVCATTYLAESVTGKVWA